MNLLHNAISHNPPGTRVRVSAAAKTADGWNGGAVAGGRNGSAVAGGTTAAEVVINVTDDGAGMPEELTAAPFEPARRRRDRSAGAGLGLSIAKGIVEAHGGRIELQRLPRGTCFRVRLPVEADV